MVILWHFGQNIFKENIFGIHGHRWEDNRKMGKPRAIKEMQCDDVG
jgi:hypothetical protein